MAKKPVKKTVSNEKLSAKESDKVKSKQKLNAKHDDNDNATVQAVKKAKPGLTKKAKQAKKQNDAELDDELLTDEVEATEEIPDLADFDEDESAEDEEEEEIETDDEDLEGSSSSGASGDDEEVILTDAEGRRLCRVRECDQAAAVETYCRFHYLQNWKRIQVRRKILADGKLGRYVEELTSRYPDKFLEMIRKDLRTEKDFLASIAELEIDESAVDNEFEDENQNFIDEVRGVTETNISDDEEF